MSPMLPLIQIQRPLHPRLKSISHDAPLTTRAMRTGDTTAELTRGRSDYDKIREVSRLDQSRRLNHTPGFITQQRSNLIGGVRVEHVFRFQPAAACNINSKT